MKELNHQQAMRYNRHISVTDMDMDGQEALMNAKVLLIGVGGLGCACAPYLVSAGFGSLTLVDFDKVESSNLQRQILHGEADIGKDKVESALQSLQLLNHECQIETINHKLDDDELSSAIAAHDIVIDCTDNLDAREQINRYCFNHRTPLISGAGIRLEGQISSFLMDGNGPCYQCLSQSFGEQQLSCVEAGVIAPVVGIIGSMQALEAIKVVSQLGQPLVGRLMLLDGKSMESRTFSFSKRADCRVCA